MTIATTLNTLIDGGCLSRIEMHDVLMGITRGDYAPEQTAALLTAVQMRGTTVDELLGLRDAVLETGVSVDIAAGRFIDIVGTGGDKKNTFNISTCACLVVAGAGYKVVKHGNYAVTSTSGASNIIEAHGVRFIADASQINRSVEECGFEYLHAPLFARAMKSVATVRKALPFPTCFNLLGPLVNPSRPSCQFLGVATLSQMRLYAGVYQEMGVDYCIANSIDGYDEISLTGDFKVKTNSEEKVYAPRQLGLVAAKPQELECGNTVGEAREIFDSVLENRSAEACKNVVIVNAAFAIVVADPAKKLEDALLMARESLESGKALQVLKKYIELHQ